MQNITVTAAAYPTHKDITVITVKGFIDTTTAPEFEKVFQSVLAENQYNLVINLKDVNYVSSAGWGIFVGEIKRIRGQKGDLFLVAMSPEVAEVFELLEFDSILKAFPDVEQAVQKGFGKVRASRGTSKAALEKAAQKNGPVESGEKPGMAISFADSPAGKVLVESPVDGAPKKSHWLARILLPWKWF